jgi:hypothetical protein
MAHWFVLTGAWTWEGAVTSGITVMVVAWMPLMAGLTRK